MIMVILYSFQEHFIFDSVKYSKNTGTGIWTEFVGAECTGAYSGAQESHFMWKGKFKLQNDEF